MKEENESRNTQKEERERRLREEEKLRKMVKEREEKDRNLKEKTIVRREIMKQRGANNLRRQRGEDFENEVENVKQREKKEGDQKRKSWKP